MISFGARLFVTRRARKERKKPVVKTVFRYGGFLIGCLGVAMFLMCFDVKSAAATSSLTMTIDSSMLSFDILPISTNGTFAKSGNSTISVVTDNSLGYKLTIASSSSTNLVGEGNNVFESVATMVSEADFSADTAAAGETYNGKWGYLPSKLNSVANANFQPSPDANGHTIDVTNVANSVANEYTIAFGARAGLDTAPGTYSNTFVVTAVANMVDYTITYNANTTDTVTNMPDPNPQTGSVDGNTATVAISSNVPTRTNYIFVEWCTAQVADGATCTGTSYVAGGDYTINHNGTNNLTLYAVWEEHVYMQDMTLSQCPANGMTVYDKRDEQAYTVAKLADDKCWMTTNLNLAGGTALYSDTSDVAVANTIESGTPYYTLPASSATSTDWQDDNTAYLYNSNSTTCAANTPCYSYYSWIAATAGSGSAATTANTNAEYSICPRGWRLPTSNRIAPYTSSDFYNLMYQYGMTDTTTNSTAYYYADANTNPNGASVFANIRENTTPNFLPAGYFYEGAFSFYYGGSSGSYWSSTASSATTAYFLSFTPTFVYSADYDDRRGGFSVRCILQ